MATIINIVAWVLCGVVGFLLFGDFIRTEIHFAKERKAEQAEKEACGNDADGN